MLKRLFLFVLSIISFGLANGQSNLVGKWRRLHAKSDSSELVQSGQNFGDLTIRSDSTFEVAGDFNLTGSDLSGWHVGDAYKGRWELDNRNSTLRLIIEENRLFQSYAIVKLTKNQLVLRSTLTLNNSKFDITYHRN